MTRAETERLLRDAYRKQGLRSLRFMWWLGPMHACVLTPVALRWGTVQWSKRELPYAFRRFAGTPQAGGILQKLEQQFFAWPRPSLEPDGLMVRELERWLPSLRAAKSEVTLQLNAHRDSSVGGRSRVFRDPHFLLNDAAMFAFVFGGEELVVAYDAPEILKLDPANRLHSESGPAVMFRDGFEVFAWHGTLVPEEWIRNKAALTPELALGWPNVEERRAACEIVGWKKILEKLDARVIDRHKDPMIGTLYECTMGMSLGTERSVEHFLEVKCGTGRTFVIPVPPTVQTAMAAQEWMWRLGPGEYKPEART